MNDLMRGVLGLGRSRSPRNDRGAAMVEMAFIFSFLVVLLVGVVTSAIAFAEKNSIENAAREASRYGATYPAPSLKPDTPATWQEWLETVRDVARAAAQGNLDADVDGQYLCVAHLSSGLKLEETSGAWNVSSGMCYDDGLSDSRVQIVTRRNTTITAVFFSFDLTLNASATTRYERAE